MMLFLVLLIFLHVPLAPDSATSTRTRQFRSVRTGEYSPTSDTVTSNVLGITWIFVKGGTFRMGNDNGLSPDESPEHIVRLTDFSMSATEVTFAQYDRFCEATGRTKPGDNGWGRDSMPVINVNWSDAYEYCEWASRVSGSAILLPTEAQWEYAARGGIKSKGCQFSGSNDINAVAWYSEDSEKRTHPVGTKLPNELGIYDMTGNVWEWCRDWYGDDYYSSSPEKDPKGPATGQYHVLRGGSWMSNAPYCRISTRSSLRSDYISINNGFRIVKEPR